LELLLQCHPSGAGRKIPRSVRMEKVKIPLVPKAKLEPRALSRWAFLDCVYRLGHLTWRRGIPIDHSDGSRSRAARAAALAADGERVGRAAGCCSDKPPPHKHVAQRRSGPAPASSPTQVARPIAPIGHVWDQAAMMRFRALVPSPRPQSRLVCNRVLRCQRNLLVDTPTSK